MIGVNTMCFYQGLFSLAKQWGIAGVEEKRRWEFNWTRLRMMGVGERSSLVDCLVLSGAHMTTHVLHIVEIASDSADMYVCTYIPIALLFTDEY